MRITATFTALSLLTTSFVSAAQNASYATYIYNSTEASTVGNDLIFSLSIDKSKGDVYFHMEAPASGSWAAVGFGDRMSDALMMVAYPSSNNTGITISPRVSNGHTEPWYTDSIKVDKSSPVIHVVGCGQFQRIPSLLVRILRVRCVGGERAWLPNVFPRISQFALQLIRLIHNVLRGSPVLSHIAYLVKSL